jgi:hypothetical protein
MMGAIRLIVASLRAFLAPRAALVAENLALRQQLAGSGCRRTDQGCESVTGSSGFGSPIDQRENGEPAALLSFRADFVAEEMALRHQLAVTQASATPCGCRV